MQAWAALDEAVSTDHACRPHPEPSHHRLRRFVVHLGEGDDRRPRFVGCGPIKGRSADLGCVTATGEDVPHHPPEFEHRLAV